MKRLILALLLSLMFVSIGIAQQTGDAAEDPEVLLKNKISSVLDILEKKDLSEAEKRTRIEQIVDPVFNYELMAKLSMGREHWSKLDKQQQKEFTGLFVQRLKVSYFDKITLYQGDADAEVNFLPARTENGKVHIPVRAKAQDGAVEMVYKMYQSGSGWQVYDAEVSGVSIVQSYRSQFNQVLARGTVEDLLEQLRKSVKAQEQGKSQQDPLESIE